MTVRKAKGSLGPQLPAPHDSLALHSDSPATLHTNYEVVYDEQKTLYRGYQSAAFTQAIQDVSQTRCIRQRHHILPRRNRQCPDSTAIYRHNHSMFANGLQAANQDHLTARTGSPVMSLPRDQSPFRQNSPFIDQEHITCERHNCHSPLIPLALDGY